MNSANRIADWLESRWVTPAYSGWLLGGLSMFFFLSATNTLSGWLYVISGISFALLAIAAILPDRMLRGIRVQRSPIRPVTAGEWLTVELQLENITNQPKSLIQVQDLLPVGWRSPSTFALETIAPRSTYRWISEYAAPRRGIYRWHTVTTRTAAPLGLFWCRRSHTAPAIAVVYPAVLPLAQCPLIDEMGRDASLQFSHDHRNQSANEGVTRSLRPYRWGDSTRLVHWRTSARYGELRVRELETFVGGQDVVICLDSAIDWPHPAIADAVTDPFEQAVIAAASLYVYAVRRNHSVKLWTAGTGLVQSSQTVLETLASVQAGETVRAEPLPTAPLIWLTRNPAGLNTLPPGSRWVLWSDSSSGPATTPSVHAPTHDPQGVLIQAQWSLQRQLEGTLDPRSP